MLVRDQRLWRGPRQVGRVVDAAVYGGECAAFLRELDAGLHGVKTDELHDLRAKRLSLLRAITHADVVHQIGQAHDAKTDAAEAWKVQAKVEEEIVSAREEEVADRLKRLELIAASAKHEREAQRLVSAARAEKEATEMRALAEIAEANAAEVRYAKDAEGQRLLNESENLRSDASRHGWWRGWHAIGEAVWFVGAHPLLVAAHAVLASARRRDLRGLALLSGYLGSALKKRRRSNDPELLEFYGHALPRQQLEDALARLPWRR